MDRRLDLTLTGLEFEELQEMMEVRREWIYDYGDTVDRDTFNSLNAKLGTGVPPLMRVSAEED